MYKNKMILIVLSFIVSSFGLCQRNISIIDLENMNILKPEFLIVHDDYVYVYDEPTGQVCKIDGGFLRKRFGKKGQGPQEHQLVHNIGIYKNKIWLSCKRGKLLYYDLNGLYLEKSGLSVGELNWKGLVKIIDVSKWIEMKMQFTSNGLVVKSYVFVERSKKSIVLTEKTVNIKVLNKRKIIFEELSQEPIVTFGNRYGYVVDDTREFCIKRFDTREQKFDNQLVNRGYHRLPLNDQRLNKYQEQIKKYQRMAGGMKFEFILPKKLPAIRNIFSDNQDNLYVMTNEQSGKKYKLKFYNRNLNFQRDLYILKPELLKVLKNKIYTIVERNGNFFLLKYSI